MNVLAGLAVTRPAAALLALLAAAACTDSDDSSSENTTTSQATVVARDYSYEMPQEIAAGVATLTLRNEGKEPHHAQIARLKDGVTLDQFITAPARAGGHGRTDHARRRAGAGSFRAEPVCHP